MKNKNIINIQSEIYQDKIVSMKNILKTEKDFAENFPKINSKYFVPQMMTSNESKLLLKNNIILTDRKNRNEKNEYQKTNINNNYINNSKKIKNLILSKNIINRNNKTHNVLSINIKNIGIEESKQNYVNTYNFRTLNDININNILKKKKKYANKYKIFKEKDSDIISINKNLENNILDENNTNNNNDNFIKNNTKKNQNIDINIKLNNNNSVKNLEKNGLKNKGVNTKISKTGSNFYINNTNNNNVIYPYKNKSENKNKIFNKTKYKPIYSRNDYNNNFRTILSSNNNKTLGNENPINLISKRYNNTTNDFKPKNDIKNTNHIFMKLLSNDIFRKVELNGQNNNKISDEYVQNLLNKEIDELYYNKKKKNNNFVNIKIKNDNSKIFKNILLKKNLYYNEDNEENKNNNNNNNNNSNSKIEKNNRYSNEKIKETENNENKNEYNKNMILSKLKGFNLQTDIQIFDAKHLKTNDILINLYMDEKDELLNDKNAMKELADYLNSYNQNSNYKKKILQTQYEGKEIYNEEEKKIIKQIIYELSNDLNQNLESYKNRQQNNNPNENSNNHVMNNISLAQLFERLNKASLSENGRRKRFTYKRNININSFNNNKNIENNKESLYKILNDILINYNDNNKNNEQKYSNKYNGTIKLLINILDNHRKDPVINNISKELKQVFSSMSNNKENNKNDKVNDNKNNNNIIISEKLMKINNNIKNILNSNNINNNSIIDIKNQIEKKILNKNIKSKTTKRKKKLNTSKYYKNEDNKSIYNDNNKKSNKNILSNKHNNNDNDNYINNDDDNISNELNIDTNRQNSSFLLDDSDDNYNEDIHNLNNDNNNISNNSNNFDDVKNNNINNQNIYLNNNKTNNNQITRSKKKSILISKSVSPKKHNKNVRFSTKDNNLKNFALNINTNDDDEDSDDDISLEEEEKKSYKNNDKYLSTKSFKFFDDEINTNKKKSGIKITNKIDDININKDDKDHDFAKSFNERKNIRISIYESLSKVKKKKFQKKARREKKLLKKLQSDDNIENSEKKEKKIDKVNLREEMLNRKLNNFFGKIKILKQSANTENYDEQLKMFIDNEIDKLNDWETKEQEMRINHFFSDLKVMKKRVAIGGEIKFANPIKFSSTWSNFKYVK